MAKRFTKIWVYPEDHQIAKTNASLRGMTLSDYFRDKVREDARLSRDKLDTMSNDFVNEKKKKLGGRKYDFF